MNKGTGQVGGNGLVRYMDRYETEQRAGERGDYKRGKGSYMSIDNTLVSRLQQRCNGTQASNKHGDDGLKIRKPQTSTDIPVCWPRRKEAGGGGGGREMVVVVVQEGRRTRSHDLALFVSSG